MGSNADSIEALPATLAGAVVHGDTITVSLAPPTPEILLKQPRRCLIKGVTHISVDRRGQGERAESAGKEGLALVDVADPCGNALIEQHVGDFEPGIDGKGPGHALADLNRRVTEIGTEMIEPPIPDHADLHDGSGKAHGHRTRRLEHCSGQMLRLSPPLARLVEIPASGHPEVGPKHEATFDLDLQKLAATLDR